MRETWVRSLGWEGPLEKGKATHSSIYCGLENSVDSPWGRKESDTTERLSLSLFPGGSDSKDSLTAMRETWVRFLSWEDPLDKENGNPFQYSSLENPTDRGAWRATAHGLKKESDTTE